jgi:hypothetical protein
VRRLIALLRGISALMQQILQAVLLDSNAVATWPAFSAVPLQQPARPAQRYKQHRAWARPGAPSRKCSGSATSLARMWHYSGSKVHAAPPTHTLLCLRLATWANQPRDEKGNHHQCNDQ